MNRDDIMEKVQNIFRDVLDNDEIVLNEQTTAQDIEEWTSLTQVQLITTIEHEFGIRFSFMDMMNWNCIGEIVDGISAKL